MPRQGERREPPEVVKRLRRSRESYRRRSTPYQVAWVTAGFIVLLAGLVMVVLPGPALVVIPIGLAMLSLQFAWAERLLETVLERGAGAGAAARELSRRQKILGAMAIVCAIGAAAAMAVVIAV